MSGTPSVAVLAAVKAAVPSDYDVRDALVKTIPNPAGHIVVYCDEGVWERMDVAAGLDSSKVSWQVSSFAPTSAGAGFYLLTVRQYLLTNGVDIPGWSHGIVTHDYTRTLTADEDVKEYPAVMAVDQFSMLLAKTA